jgi:dTDP-4-dehydrorhamnose reductase
MNSFPTLQTILKPMKKLLVTGAGGFLGWNICMAARTRYEVTGLRFTHNIAIEGVSFRRVDITEADELERLFREVRPHAVIHAAAASDPNYCERHPLESARINVDAPRHIARLCAESGARCAFTSTDLVFDGENPPYSEGMEPRPISVYGRQKLEAEQRMRDVYPNVLICRMPLMFGDAPAGAKSFIQPMMESLLNGKELGLFIDEFRTPVAASDAARGILSLLENLTGLIHLGGKVRISRYDFGLLLSECLGILNPPLKRVARKDIVMSAPRPADVSLDSSKACKLGYSPEGPMEALRRLQCVKSSVFSLPTA